MATVRSNFNLGDFASDLRAQEQGYTSTQARERIMTNANSGKLARRAARKEARRRERIQTNSHKRDVDSDPMGDAELARVAADLGLDI